MVAAPVTVYRMPSRENTRQSHLFDWRTVYGADDERFCYNSALR